MTATYNTDNTLTELPGPEPTKRFEDLKDYETELKEYRERLAKLRTLVCSPECRGLWKPGQVLEEGKDYEVRKIEMRDTGYPFEHCEQEFAFPLPSKPQLNLAHMGAGDIRESEEDRTGIFPVQRLTNGAGHSNLTIVTEEAITDIFIGSVLLVPFVNGYKDPKEVKVVVDDRGKPVATKLRTCIVTEYIH